jgi:hypothetical protein
VTTVGILIAVAEPSFTEIGCVANDIGATTLGMKCGLHTPQDFMEIPIMGIVYGIVKQLDNSTINSGGHEQLLSSNPDRD